MQEDAFADEGPFAEATTREDGSLAEASTHVDLDLLTAKELLSSAEDELAAIDLAIEALGAGTFGRCELCGADIEPDRLKVDLDARRCAAHLL